MNRLVHGPPTRRCSRRRGIAPFAICLLAAVGTTACNPPPDAAGTTDVELTPRTGLPFPDTDTGRAVESHLEALFAMGPDAEANYQASLAALRARGAEAVATIMSTYSQADKTLYGERAVLVETLTELRMPEARDSLLAIANEELPERVPAPDDTISAIEREAIIRMTAIRGLGHLAVADDVAAGALAELARHRELSLNEQAKQSLALVIAQEKDRLRRQRLIALFPGEFVNWVPPVLATPPTPSRN